MDITLHADRLVGDRVASAVSAHHRRRLARLGHRPLDAPPGGWADDAPAPREGNRLDVLVDGEHALDRMVAEMRTATAYVHITGWYMSPEFVLTEEDGTPVVVRNLLAELAHHVDVRVLLWAGAPVPVFKPSRRMVRRVRKALTAHDGVRCALDPHERPLHCHHEKTIVVDGRVAFVGGIDFTSLAGDRRDSSRHPSRARLGWHDISARVEGPVVTDVAEHFAMRWRTVTGESVAVPAAQPRKGSTTVQFVRTVPERIYPELGRGSFGVLETYARAIRSARELIYVESQYLWSAEVTELLAEKLHDPPSERFRMVVVLPGKPHGGADDTRGALSRLVDADGGRGRVLGCALYARAGALADVIYVHAKLAVVDDRLLIVGSANLNDHSMFNDTEACLVTDDREIVRKTRLRLWAEHLECDEGEVAGDATEIVDNRWIPIAEEQLHRRRAGQPMTHRLTRLEHVSRRSARILGPLQGMLVDG
jgi:phosphatidylserine/phosphatidylglycerophosphate/cardiolipin synthase-like enzyme